jgi:hypothetical protein
MHVAVGILVLGTSQPAMADQVTITGYDIQNANLPGSGGWSHYYLGTITMTDPDAFWEEGLANYSGGTGTLANGIIESTEAQIQLFRTGAEAVITLYLDAFYTINTIDIFGGDTSGNAIPGEIDGMNVTINSSTQQLLGVGFGGNNAAGTPRNDRFTLFGTSLEGLVTDRIVLSSIFEDGCCDAYSIAEIGIEGSLAQVAPVPEPATLGLISVGAAFIGLRHRRRQMMRKAEDTGNSQIKR